MKNSLFVYGTLMPNAPHERVLQKIYGNFIKASIKGFLKDEGWSASMGYHGIKIDPKGDTIHGYIFYSTNLINHWKRLDEFEGKEFKRVTTIVERYDEIEEESYVYVLKDHKDG